MSSLQILVTGSRDWTDEHVIRNALYDVIKPWCDEGHGISGVVIIHGAARGADSIAAGIGHRWGTQVRDYPVTGADWDRYGKAAGHRRNAEMVALGADVCLAFPIGESRGTRDCIARAEKAGIPVVIHEGSVS